MFEQHISSDILFHHDDKIISRNLYLCQPHTVIQLIEVAPPRRISSVVNSSPAASSSYTSYTSSSSSSFEENHEEEEVVEEEEEESIHSSYCSSDDEMDVPLSPRTASHPDTFSGRMKRILLWREQSPQLASDSISLKRRLEEIEDVLDNDDNVSKRSRSSGSSSSVSSSVSLELMHSCPACDAFFPTRQSLRQHGQDAQSNEACSVAVEYAFE